jgi:6-phosphofructokinase 1
MFFVEVMGRDAGFIAMNTGIAGGAEAILIPESKTDIDALVDHLRGSRPTHSSSIVVVAEGDDQGGAVEIANKVKSRFDGYDTRVVVLGHIQRGGKPSCADRVLSTRLGVAAVEALLDGASACMNEVVRTPFDQAIKHHADISQSLLKLATMLNCYY